MEVINPFCARRPGRRGATTAGRPRAGQAGPDQAAAGPVPAAAGADPRSRARRPGQVRAALAGKAPVPSVPRGAWHLSVGGIHVDRLAFSVAPVSLTFGHRSTRGGRGHLGWPGRPGSASGL